MVDILFARTFLIVGAMLVLTAVTARVNRVFETSLEMWSTILASFAFLILILVFSDQFPLNLFLVAGFSLVMGWCIGPTIEHFGLRYKLRRYLRANGIPLKKGQNPSDAQIANFKASFDTTAYHREWQNKVTLAVLGTALSVLVTALTVLFTDISFSFLGGYLFVFLSMLVLMSIVNTFFIGSKMVSLVQAYIGAVIFTLYLLYDFNRLKLQAGDESWETAIDISVDIYLDIINLFLDLLEILAESN